MLTRKYQYLYLMNKVFQKFDLSKAMPTHVTHVLLLIICVMSFHVQSKIFLSIELLPTFLAGIIEVGAVAHLLVLLELRLPLVALLAFVALVRLVGAVHVLHVVVEPGVAGEVLGAQVTHEAAGRVVLLSRLCRPQGRKNLPSGRHLSFNKPHQGHACPSQDAILD